MAMGMRLGVVVLAASGGGLAAFAASAEQHALDVIIAQGMCGNASALLAPQLLGHCADCWISGVSVAGLVLSAGLFWLPRLRLRPAAA